MKLKLLGGVIIAGVAVWLGWWWIAATAQKEALNAWLAERRAAGWQAEAAEIAVNGFPNRLDVTVTRPALADPQSGWAWEAPFLLIHQVIYDPTFFRVAWPNSQTIAAPGAAATLTSDVMQASLAFSRSDQLLVERASFELRGAFLEGVDGWRAAAKSWVHHIRRAPDAGPDNAYEFRADGDGVAPPAVWRDMIDPAGALPKAIDRIALEGRIAFDRPLDRFALEADKPQVTGLTFKEARADWGGLSLDVTGAVRADREGYAEGEMQVTARQWRDMVTGAVNAGVLSPSAGDAVVTGLGLLARLSGDGDEISAPLTFSGGFTRIGPVPIGPAPRMVR